MTDILKSETSYIDSLTNSSNQPNDSKSNFHPNSAYRSLKKKTLVTRKNPAGIVAKYIAAMNAYDALCSDENYQYLDEAYKEYKDCLELNQ
jgi:hypothetical protein